MHTPPPPQRVPECIWTAQCQCQCPHSVYLFATLNINRLMIVFALFRSKIVLSYCDDDILAI